MESNELFPMPVRNYAKKVMELAKRSESVKREPPRRRLVPVSNAQADLSKKSQKSCIPANQKGLTQRLAVSYTRTQTVKGPTKLNMQEQTNRSIHTRIPLLKPGSQNKLSKKSHVAASRNSSLNRRTLLAPRNRSHSSKPNKVSEENVLEADISGVMLLEEDARSEVGAGECSNKMIFRIPLGPIPQNTDQTREMLNFEDAFNSLQMEYLSQLTKFHTDWMEKFRQLYKRKEESVSRKVPVKEENMELMSQRKSKRLSQKKCVTPKETPSRKITNTAKKQMKYLDSFLYDS